MTSGRRNRHRLRPSRAGRTALWVVFSGSSQSVRKAHRPQGQARQQGTAAGDWRKTQFAQGGVIPGKFARKGGWEERSRSGNHAVS